MLEIQVTGSVIAARLFVSLKFVLDIETQMCTSIILYERVSIHQVRLVLGWAFSNCKRVDRTVFDHPRVKVAVTVTDKQYCASRS